MLWTVTEALGALVRPDLRGVLVLRLDDPGASVRRYLGAWRHEDVPATTWAALWRTLEGFGRVSVFACPGWVRPDGSVVASRDESPLEWAALDDGVAAGVADLECHGFTHFDPDTSAWAAALDRFDDIGWYRELWPPRLEHEPPVAEQEALLAAWQAACGPGTTVVAPGEAWGLNTIVAARRRGFRLFNSWEVCRLDGAVPTWTSGVGSPYLDEPVASSFAAGLPTVGYWHDRDMVRQGPDWVATQLSAWKDCGARQGWAFADLARAYALPVEAALVDGDVVLRGGPDGAGLLVERA